MLHPLFTPDHEELRAFVRKFVESELAPHAQEWEEEGDDWVINGRKIFITNGVRADFITLVTRTNKAEGYDGFSLFLVDKDTPGFEVSRKLDKLGMRASDTAELAFDDVRVPSSALLGTEGKGFY